MKGKRGLLAVAAAAGAAVGAGCTALIPGPPATLAPLGSPLMPPRPAEPMAWPIPTPDAPQATVSTYAGTDQGHADGARETARFDFPTGLAFDARGNLYIGSEFGDHSIRVIAPTGEVRTLAGDLDGLADGPGPTARFRSPRGLAVDPRGNVFVADSGNNRIRKIAPDGVVSTIAGSWGGFKDGPADQAQFWAPSDVALDPAGNLLIADSGNNRIRMLTPDGTVSTYAGGSAASGAAGPSVDGPASQARFSRPVAIDRDSHGNLFVVEQESGALRKISAGGTVTTVARVGGSVSIVGPPGSGLAGWTASGPRDVAVGPDGTLFVAASWRICKIEPHGDTPITIAGFGADTAPDHDAVNGNADGPALRARFRGANSLAIGPDSALYVADNGNHRIRRIVLPK